MTKLEKLCIRWLNKNYNHMVPFYIKEYPVYIFHMKDGRCILQHNIKNGYVCVNHREIWRFFENNFSMKFEQIQEVTKLWVEEHYKLGLTTTPTWNYLLISSVEEHYKLGLTTTFVLQPSTVTLVEEHYKMSVTTTNDQNNFYFRRDVEELYKLNK
jgi:hypothetical protein